LKEDRLVIGFIRRTHGLTGFLKAESASGETAHFGRLEKVWLRKDGREWEAAVEQVRPTAPGELLIKFRGCDVPETARLYSGCEILVPRGQAAPLKEGEFYLADLIGCRLISPAGPAVSPEEPLGRVRGVCQGAQAELLEVETGGRVFFVPFLAPFVGRLDLENRTLELLAPWLLE
jgi:16S rRNA processing protein RimM